MEIARYSDQLEVSSARPVRVSSPALIPLATIPGDIGIIGDLYQSAQDVLQFAIVHKPMHISVNQQQTFKRASQLLFLWGEAHGASDGALDWKLQKSPRLLHLVVKILRSLLKYIVLGVMGNESTAQSRTVWRLLDRARHVKLSKEYASPESSEDETSSEASEDERQHDVRSSTSDMNQTMGQIMETIECLQDLESSITTPALDVKDELTTSSLPHAEPIALHESFSSMIRETFPNADYLLVGDLGKANLRRFRAMLGLRTTEELQARADVAQIAASDTKSRPQSSNHDSGYGSKETASQQSMQIAPTESAYASSVASSLSEGARSKYPPLPDEAKQGSSFECAACARQIKVQSKRQYRDHLKQDLQPYTCIINTCNAPQKHFVSRALWIDHMNEHLDANTALWASACPLCAVAMPGERYNLLAHVGKHLEEIALAVIPRDADGDEDDSVSERTDIEDDAVNVMSTTKLSALSPPTITIEAAPASSQTQFEAGPSVPRSRTKERPFGFGALERDHSEGIAAGAQSDDDAKTETAAKRTQKHPATFQCTLCPKRFTRAYNLRAHLRTHTDDRPYVCNVCGKAFARQHDRKRHEGLHSGEKKFICAGELKDGNKWGCGRRFARADALGRHFRSDPGRVCIKPMFREEAIDESPEQLEMQTLPQALLDQYPALRDIDWSAWSLPPGDEDEGYLGDTSATRLGGGDDYTSDGRIYPGIHMQAARMASPDYAQTNPQRDAPQMDANNDLLLGLADRERRKLLQQEEIFERMEREDMQRTKRRPHRSAPSRMQMTGPFSAQPHDQTRRSGSGRERSNAFIDTSVYETRVSVQNPPCNTLDVGNLSFSTSEDDLKALFSTQPGYKRLCFRTKQTGPMCFVEFESVEFAAKALRGLQGPQLHNGVNGGITLGYSKNPLGVRSGEPSEGSEFGFNPLMYDSAAQLGQQPFNSGAPQAQFPYAPDVTFDPIDEGSDLGLNTAGAMGKQPAADAASDAWNRLANDTYPVLDENLLATEDGILTKIPSPMHSAGSISDEPGRGIVNPDSGKVSPHRSMVDEFLQRAQDARAQSPTSDNIRKGADPFRPGSLLKPYPAAAPQLTPTGRLKRTKAQGSRGPRTIEPKDALVDYVLNREEGRMPPIEKVDGLRGLGDWTHEEAEEDEEYRPGG